MCILSNLCAAVDDRIIGVREVDEVDAVLLRVDRALLRALLAVVDHDLVVLAARDEVLAVLREVDGVDLVRVLAKHLGHLEAAQHRIHQLHLHRDGGGSCVVQRDIGFWDGVRGDGFQELKHRRSVRMAH